MRLGVPFIAPRQLGAVESNLGRQFLPSVDWRTGQSGAPPNTVRSGFLSFFGEADRWRLRAVGAPDSPMLPSDCWLGPVSRPDSAADRWPGRPLAHWTVWSTPDSPVNFSRTPSANSRERPVRPSWSCAPDTVRCTTGQSGAPDRTAFWLYTTNFSLTLFLLFPVLRHDTLVLKTKY